MIDDIAKSERDKCRWYDVLEIKSRGIPLSFKNNRMYSLVENQNHGFGIRVNIDGKTGFSYTNNSDQLDATFKRAVSMAPFGDREGYDLPCQMKIPVMEPYREEINNADVQTEIETGNETISRLLKQFPGISIDMGIGISNGTNSLYNSSGLKASYRYSRYSVSVSATMTFDDGSRLSISEGKSALRPEPYDDIVDTLSEKIRNALSVRKTASGRLPVIFTPKALSSLMGILATGLSSRTVYKGISPFEGKLGKKIFSESFTLEDNPLLDNSPFSFPFDDEGIPARLKRVVDRGILTTYITDLKYAEKLGIDPTGNGTRGYSSLPAPSFSNILIAGGTTPIAEIISSVETGLLVDQFIGLGQSNTLTGDFKTSLDLAYLIEKGDITGRVKDCMLTDNLFTLLKGESERSKERCFYGSALIPYMLFPSVNFTQ